MEVATDRPAQAYHLLPLFLQLQYVGDTCK